ncbi:MAG: hypothetical protein ACYCO3_16715, partial [Mycobacteriales bacterium]
MAMNSWVTRRSSWSAVAAGAASALVLALGVAPSAAATSSGEFIVTGTGVSAVSSAVTTAGGSVLTSLPIVNGVLAQLP